MIAARTAPRTVRTLSGLLALLLLLSSAACAGTSERETSAESLESEEPKETETDALAFPEVQKKDYKRQPFRMVKLDYLDPWYYVGENHKGTLETAIYDMNRMVEDHLNVQLEMEAIGEITTGGEVFSRVKPSMMAGDDDYQLCILHPYYSYNSFISRNFATDFYTLDALDLDREYWNKPVMDSLALRGHAFIGLGDLCQYLTNVLYVNKNLMKEAGRPVPYDRVRNGEWTLDDFISLTTGLYRDNGDGEWDNRDTYGFASLWDANGSAFMQAGDIYVMSRNEDGDFELSMYGDRLEDLYYKLYMWSNDESVYLWKHGQCNDPAISLDFLHNRSYFTLTSLGPQYLGASFDFGILPLPKYDRAQENYAHVNWGNNIVVPSTVKDPRMVGEVLEMMGYYSRTIVLEAYYNTVLQYRVSDSPDDSEMVRLVHDTVTYDPGIAYCDGHQELWNLVYMVCFGIRDKRESCASYYKSQRGGAERAIREIMSGKKAS